MKDTNTYVKTYFRINTPSYNFSNGYDSQESKNNFYEDVRGIFTKLGFEIKEPKNFSGSCQEGYRGIEKLYFHPQEISGYINKESITEIKKALSEALTFKLRFTDTYDEVLNYTEEEFLQELNNRKEKIEQDILGRFKTKRRNLYLPERAKDHVKSGLKYFVSSVVGCAPLERVEMQFISDLFSNLINEGKLIQAETKQGVFYRTITDKDIKENRKKSA